MTGQTFEVALFKSASFRLTSNVFQFVKDCAIRRHTETRMLLATENENAKANRLVELIGTVYY